ncbi:MAG: Crp/Fnr family transcriptional regulator [Pseudomonadota bacterium]
MNEHQKISADIVATLTAGPHWQDLEVGSLDALLAKSAVIEAQRGQVLQTRIGLMLSGVVGFETGVADGRRALTELFHEGDLIDLRRHDRPSQGRLVCLSDARLINIEPAAFDACIRRHADFGDAFVKQIEDQTGRLRDHTADLVLKTPVERMVSALFEFDRWPEVHEGLPEGDRLSLHLPLLRKDLADYVGVKPETISRTLRRLLQQGLIETDPADTALVRLLDRSRLRMIANGGAPRGARAHRST